MRARDAQLTIALVGIMLALGLAACGSGSTTPAGSGTLKGQILEPGGAGVGDATVKAGTVSATTDYQGNYELAEVPAGKTTVTVTADWFADKEQEVEVQADVTNDLDVTLAAKPLQALPADTTLADTYNQTFDWATDKVSIAYVASPTRANVDKALYYRNPALYRDTSGQATITPSPLPAISGTTATGFDFPIPTGAPNAGQQALDVSTIVDSLAATPLSAAAKERSVLWEPAVKLYLIAWDTTKAESLYYVGLAIDSQRWGATSSYSPQTIEHTYVDQGALWVKVVFQPWVTLGAGVTDSDGDGRKEIFARVGAAHVGAEALTKLLDDYVTPTYTTLTQRDDLTLVLDDLYTRTSPEIVSVIGEPYDVTGLGTISYPFVVLRHSNSAINVLVVAAP